MNYDSVMRGYMVYRCDEGSALEFLGRVELLKHARVLAERCHKTGAGLPASEWDTAHAAGHCMGIRAPIDEIDDGEFEIEAASIFLGADGYYVAVPVFSVDIAKALRGK